MSEQHPVTRKKERHKKQQSAPGPRGDAAGPTAAGTATVTVAGSGDKQRSGVAAPCGVTSGRIASAPPTKGGARPERKHRGRKDAASAAAPAPPSRAPNAGLLRLPKSVVLPPRPGPGDAAGETSVASAPARHLDSAACDRPPELEDRLREFWAVEKKAAQHVEAVRRDRGMLQDVCLLGVEVGARELNGCLVVLQLSCEEICDFVADEASSGEAVLDHTRAAVDCVTRLLAVYKSVADIFCAVLEKKSSSSSHQDRRVQICRVFSTEVDGIVLWIGCQLQFLSDLHQPVRVWCQVEVAPADCDFYFSAAQAIYIALGDLSRYKEMHSPDQTPPDFRYALSYYQRALLVRAPTGAVHKKFATVAKASACPFEVIFHLFLCQSAHDSPFNSRDLLLDLLENQRACARALPETHALSQLTARQHYDRFVSHLLSCVSICYSRTGSDTFRQHLDSMRRHLSTLLQTHAATAPHRECDGHVGADDDILNNLQNDLTAGFTIILSVLYAVVKKNKAWELLSEELKFQSSSSSSSPALDTDPDVLQMLVTRRLNDLRSVPGFLDGIRLVCVFLVCVTGGTGLGLYSSLQDDADKYRELSRFRITLQSVSVFFDWIKSNEIYHIIPVLDFKLWKQLEASLQSYFDVLRRVLGGTSDKLTADSVLAEDFALRGFSPLCHTIRCRFDVCVSNHRWSTKQVFAPPVIDSSCQSNIFALAAAAATVSSPQEALRIRLLRCQHTMDYLSARTVNLPRSCWPNCSRNLLSLSGDARSHSDASGEEIDICFADDLKAVLAVRHVCCSDVNKKLLSLLDCSLNMQSLGCAATSATPGYKAPKRNSMLLPGFNVTARTDGDAAGEGSDAATEEELCGHTPAPDDTDTRDVGVEDEAKRSIVDTNRHNSTYPQSAGILHVDMSSVAVGVPTSNLSKQISNRDNRKSQKRQEISARKMQSDALYGRMFPGQQIGIVKGSGFDATQLPTIVLDVPNIAMRHGLNSRFSCLGIRIVFDYFLHVGHKVVGFLPDYYFDMERIGELRRAAAAGVKSTRAAKLPDDIHILQQLAAQGYLIGTPSQDYDDSYCISYAKSHDGYLVTNDMYRDHIAKITDGGQRNAVKHWLQAHCISYTFVHNEFLPNPDAKFG